MELKMVVDACARDGSDARDCNFSPLLDWDDVMRDERDDPLGFARRATLALLTQPSAGLLAGFRGDNQKALEEARRTVHCFRHTCGGRRGLRKWRRGGWGEVPRFLLLPGSRSSAGSTTL